jgi:hypothetical protein
MNYLSRLCVITSAILAAIAGFTVVVDPFAIYGTPVRSGFNADKIALADYVRFAKPLQILRRQPEVVLLGTSRIRDGIDPVDLGVVADAFNYGVPALSMIEAEAFAEHAMRVAPVRELIVGLDFFQFSDHEPYHAGFDRDLLGGGISFHAFFQSTLSYVAVVQSWLTVADNRADPSAISYRSDGFRVRDELSPGDIDDGILIDVQRSAERYDRMGSIDASLRALERMLSDASQRDVDVRLFFSPMHAALHEAVYRSGSWLLFEQCKRDVLAIARCTDTPLWDFSGYNEVTIIPFDDAGRHYFDGSHYRPEIGRRILDVVRQNAGDSGGRGELQPQVQPGGFGFRLSPDSLETHLNATRVNRAAYVRSTPQDIARIEASLNGVPVDAPWPAEPRRSFPTCL